jgi:hypothetical protein
VLSLVPEKEISAAAAKLSDKHGVECDSATRFLRSAQGTKPGGDTGVRHRFTPRSCPPGFLRVFFPKAAAFKKALTLRVEQAERILSGKRAWSTEDKNRVLRVFAGAQSPEDERAFEDSLLECGSCDEFVSSAQRISDAGFRRRTAAAYG